ncbi:MAG TPA: hypothetical protein VHR66_06805 [Gemmataceae bacterium]|jgi:hypothetical protein|nr:hypothetical protein [Gemmataceae bacterium]
MPDRPYVIDHAGKVADKSGRSPVGFKGDDRPLEIRFIVLQPCQISEIANPTPTPWQSLNEFFSASFDLNGTCIKNARVKILALGTREIPRALGVQRTQLAEHSSETERIDRTGKVADKSGRGPFGFNVSEVEQALTMHLLEGVKAGRK